MILSDSNKLETRIVTTCKTKLSKTVFNSDFGLKMNAAMLLRGLDNTLGHNKGKYQDILTKCLKFQDNL